jgi:two-component system chemotaxis response regulator CheY
MSNINSLDKKMPILIVDDFSTMRRVMKNCLTKLGFENVTEAEDGSDALSKLKDQKFKFIISDWNMPNMMGLDFLKAVRDDEAHGAVPFLLVTAESQKDNVFEAARAGVSNYIVKPFTADILHKKMETIFKNQS